MNEFQNLVAHEAEETYNLNLYFALYCILSILT